MQLGILYTIRTDPTVDFTGAIAQNAMAVANITPEGFLARRFRLTNLVIESKEALDWELWLWLKDYGAGPAVPGDAYLAGYWGFQGAFAKQIGGAGLYYYFIPGLDVFYEDLNFESPGGSPGPNPTAPVIHLGLVNRSAAAKTAGAAGAVLVQMQVDPCLGY